MPTNIEGNALPAMISNGRKGVTSNWSKVPVQFHFGAGQKIYFGVHDAVGVSEGNDAWLDVIGVVSAGATSVGKASSGVRTRARERTTGEMFTAIVRKKARARRPR